MIVIPLKSQHASLIISFFSAASELAFLFAALNWNGFFECMALQKGERLTVRHHLNRTRLLALTTAFIFIIVEILNSFYSDPTFIIEAKPCRFLTSANVQENLTTTTYQFNRIALSCVDADETKVWLRGGNLFEDGESVVQCSDQIFSFDREPPQDESLPEDYVVECETVLHQTYGEIELCSLLYRKGNRVAFSELLPQTILNNLTQNLEEMPLRHTDVFFDVSGREQEFASRAVFHLSTGERDEVELRRKVFTSEGEGECQVPVDATEVSSALMWAMIGIWITSFLIFTVTLLFRSRIFFNMSNPLHWAQKAVIDDDGLGGEKNPIVSSFEMDGKMFVVLSCSTNSEQDESGV